MAEPTALAYEPDDRVVLTDDDGCYPEHGTVLGVRDGRVGIDLDGREHVHEVPVDSPKLHHLRPSPGSFREWARGLDRGTPQCRVRGEVVRVLGDTIVIRRPRSEWEPNVTMWETYCDRDQVVLVASSSRLAAAQRGSEVAAEAKHGTTKVDDGKAVLSISVPVEDYGTAEAVAMVLTARHDRYEALLAEHERVTRELEDLRENPRDKHHTMTELYDYRLLYNAHAARGWLAAGIPVVRSWKHSDGQPCFDGRVFIVVATLPTGQVSNHYDAAAWDLFAGVPAVDLPPEYDGHTPAVAEGRLREALTTTAPPETVDGLDLPTVHRNSSSNDCVWVGGRPYMRGHKGPAEWRSEALTFLAIAKHIEEQDRG